MNTVDLTKPFGIQLEIEENKKILAGIYFYFLLKDVKTNYTVKKIVHTHLVEKLENFYSFLNEQEAFPLKDYCNYANLFGVNLLEMQSCNI